VENRREKYLPFSPRAWREANLEVSNSRNKGEVLLESDSVDSSEYDDTLESERITVTPEARSKDNTPKPWKGQDYFAVADTRRTTRKMMEPVKVKIFRGERDGRDQDRWEFFDDVKFLVEQWCDRKTSEKTKQKKRVPSVSPRRW